ncbi:MAG TPA: cytochrome c oxidase subunit II [Allosphingosinicella sp.]|nr:cytochrome c oxidase subunit II [Allosphingosinicella sp.]
MRRLLPGLAAVALVACEGRQSVTGGDGLHSGQFNSLFLIFLLVTAFFYLLVIAFLVAAVVRRRGRAEDRPEKSGGEGGFRLILIGWVALVALGLTGLTAASYFSDAAAGGARPANAIRIAVTANQWWWDVRYLDPVPANTIRTANELHLPVGVPVHIQLKSNDVIHSFWVPNLAGKQDLIPGRITDITLIPRKEGLYRGQCAEFCGLQHAHMALDVTVEPMETFEAWRRSQLRPAPPPATPLAVTGYNYIMTQECSACHNISGTPASGQVAPDLTHIASRRSIGAGTFPMSRGHLYAWIADPQSAKPGNHMPYVGLEPHELHGVVAYLETLK